MLSSKTHLFQAVEAASVPLPTFAGSLVAGFVRIMCARIAFGHEVTPLVVPGPGRRELRGTVSHPTP